MPASRRVREQVAYRSVVGLLSAFRGSDDNTGAGLETILNEVDSFRDQVAFVLALSPRNQRNQLLAQNGVVGVPHPSALPENH